MKHSTHRTEFILPSNVMGCDVEIVGFYSPTLDRFVLESISFPDEYLLDTSLGLRNGEVPIGAITGEALDHIKKLYESAKGSKAFEEWTKVDRGETIE